MTINSGLFMIAIGTSMVVDVGQTQMLSLMWKKQNQPASQHFWTPDSKSEGFLFLKTS